MTSSNVISIKRENLIQQLRGLKFIVDEVQDVLNQNPVSREFLAFKIDIAHNLIQEMQLWEELGNQNKFNSVFDDARFFLEQAQVLMDRILDEQCEKAWMDSQKNFRYTIHASTQYEFVLSKSAEVSISSVAG